MVMLRGWGLDEMLRVSGLVVLGRMRLRWFLLWSVCVGIGMMMCVKLGLVSLFCYSLWLLRCMDRCWCMSLFVVR